MLKLLLLKAFCLSVTEAWGAKQYASQGLILKESTDTAEDASPGGPDPTCMKGLRDPAKQICCSPKCWTCGEHAMCSKPKKFFEITGNTHTDCCQSVIKLTQRKCEKNSPPCILSQKFRAQEKADLIKPINEERHTRNKAVIKQRQFRFILYYKVKTKYDFATDIARDVRALSGIKVKQAKANIKKFKGLLGEDQTQLLKIMGNSTVVAKGPIKRAVWQVQVELNEDESRFYAQIRRNARLVAGNATEGLNRVDEMKVKVQTNLDKINEYQGEVTKLHKDANQTHTWAKMLWQQWTNNAKTFNCSPTPVVEHCENKITVPNTAVRRVHVKCQIGYDSKQSKNSLRCLKQGDFGKALFGQISGVATCVGRNCGKPPDVKLATTVQQDIIHPNEAAYSCFEGHTMNGAASGAKTFSIKCNKLGKFNFKEHKHKCQPIRCGPAPKVDNSLPIPGKFHFAQRAHHKCKVGYTIDGMSAGVNAFYTVCQATGHFSPRQKCRPVLCGPSPQYDVTKHDAPSPKLCGGKEGGTCKCNGKVYYGRKFASGKPGSGQITSFDKMKQWSVKSKKVNGRVKCSNRVFGDPTPGFYKHCYCSEKEADQYYPMESLYACDKGYSLNQKYGGAISYTLVCHSNGEFAPKGNEGEAVPVCRAVSGGMSPKFPHGNYQSKEMFFGDSAVVTADSGYSLISKAAHGLHFTIAVTDKGAYSGVKQFKPVDCGAAPVVANSKTPFAKPTAVFTDQLSYECTKGYSVDASKLDSKAKFIIHCQADGTLSPVPAKGECVNIDDCAEHTCGPFGHCKDLLLNYTCVCADGYEETYDEALKERICGNIDDCGPEACGAGECIDGVNTYECICPSGYEVKMTAEGETCRKVTCGTPPQVEFSMTKPNNMQTEKIYYQGKVNYECQQGYTLNGKADGKNTWQVSCGAVKIFSDGETCKPVDCGRAPSVEHATSGGDTAKFPEVIKYHCKNGHSIDTTPTGDTHFHVTCGHSGDYSLPLTCPPILCGEPDTVANAQRASGKLKYQDTIKYTCFDGFTIDGKRDSVDTFEATCQANGKLTSLETCNPRICGNPVNKIDVLHATVPATGVLYFPQVATVTCRDGFTVGGDPKGKPAFIVKCAQDGHFEDSYDKRECKAVRCGAVPELPNATLLRIVHDKTGKELDTKNLNFGERATYKCAEGFTAGGELDAKAEVKAECFPSGAFSVPPDDLMCRNVDDCSQHTCGPKGTCIDLIGPAPAYTCKCEPGFEIQKMSNGEKFCGNVDDCGKDKCGTGTCQDLVKGFTCICPTGHYLGDSDVDGEVTCLPVLCAEKVPEVAKADREDSHTGRVVYPTTLRYKCQTGYSVDASPVDAKSKFQASCKAHGKLMGMMKCLPITCGTPHIFEFTDRLFPQSRTSILEYGQSAKYKCHEGYSIKGTPDGTLEFSSACSATGVLGDPEVCEPIICGTPPRIAKCRSSHAGVMTYGMDVQYECDKGHTLSGKHGGEHHFHRKCRKDGTFEALEGSCKAVSAGKVPEIPGAKLFQYAGRPVEHGESLMQVPRKGLEAFYPQGLEYKCHEGYSLTGGVEGHTKFVTQVNSVGQFAPPLPLKCKRITFKIQGEVKNAQTGTGCIGCSVKVAGRNDNAVTDDGFFTIDNIEAGQIKLLYSREGFISGENTIDVTGDVTSGGLADISMSPVMGSKEWRAVVKWGSYPEDLDSYASWATNTVSWDNPYAQSGYEVKLEVDDTDGYGPETVHLSNVGTCDGGAYECDIKYFINDYEDTGNMYADSEAHVDLYHGDAKAGSWNIKDCKDSLDEDGSWWHVFTINGKTNQLKWHCGQSSSTQVLLKVGSNATLSAAKVDFENYVGPFPGRYFRRSRRHVVAPKQIRRLRSQASK